MKASRLLFPFSILILLMAVPVNATFVWENNITVKYDEVQWSYKEIYTEGNALIYKDYVDLSLGNGDGFISAWEVLKTDVKTRSTLEKSILKQMNVLVNNSSESVVLADVSSSMSPELLGPVMQPEVIENLYTANYHFGGSFLGSGNGSISFIGEQHTPLVINMPEGIDITSTEGIDNVSVINDGKVAKIQGSFDSTGKATVLFQLDGITALPTSVPEVITTNASVKTPAKDQERQNFSLAWRILPALRISDAERTE